MKEKDTEGNITRSAQTESSKCRICRHFVDGDVRTCKAFPDGIPNDVFHDSDHHKKHPLQKGDVTFEINDKFKELYNMFYDENHNKRPETDEPEDE